MATIMEKSGLDSIPRNVDDSPEVRSAVERYNRVRSQLSELRGRVHEIIQGLTPDRRQTLDELADEVLDGKPILSLDAGKIAGLRAELGRLQNLIPAVVLAVEKADREIQEARVVASKAATPVVLSEYKEILNRMAAAMVELRDAGLDERDLRDRFYLSEWKIFPSLIRPMPLLGLSTDPVSPDRFTIWLREAAEYGLIDQ